MLELNEEIKLLITLMQEKNELGSERKLIRSKRNRLQNILHSKKYTNIEKKAKAGIAKVGYQNNNLHRAAEDFINACPNSWMSEKRISEIVQEQGLHLVKASDNFKSVLDEAQRQLKYHPLLSKHKKRKISDIKLDFLEVDAEYAMINLKIARFTKKNRTIMAKLSKKYDLKRVSDGSDNRYSCLRDNNGNRVDKKDIERIAIDQKIIKAFGLKEEESESVT